MKYAAGRTTGRLRFSRRCQTLLDQLRLFPHAAKDDAPDALALAITCAPSRIRVFTPGRPGYPSRRPWWEDSDQWIPIR